MTIKDAVRNAIAQMPGNTPLSIANLAKSGLVRDATDRRVPHDRIESGLRKLSHVRLDEQGNYRVKGRRVPPK